MRIREKLVCKAANRRAAEPATKSRSRGKKFDGWATLKGRFVFDGLRRPQRS